MRILLDAVCLGVGDVSLVKSIEHVLKAMNGRDPGIQFPT